MHPIRALILTAAIATLAGCPTPFCEDVDWEDKPTNLRFTESGDELLLEWDGGPADYISVHVQGADEQGEFFLWSHLCDQDDKSCMESPVVYGALGDAPETLEAGTTYEFSMFHRKETKGRQCSAWSSGYTPSQAWPTGS